MNNSAHFSPSRDYYLLILLLSFNIVLMTENTTETVHLWRDFCNYLAVPSLHLSQKIINRPGEVGQRLKDILRVYEINQTLNSEIKVLKAQQNYWQTVAQENSRLRDLLSLRPAFPYKIEIARIHLAGNPGEQIIAFLDKGSERKITSGLPVAAFWHNRLYLVGLITQSYLGYSRMFFLNNELVNVPVVIKGEDKDFSGLLRGSAAGELRIDYLSDVSDSILGREVLVSENSRIYPAGLLIGYVQNVEKFANQVSVTVRSPVDYRTLTEAVIIIK